MPHIAAANAPVHQMQGTTFTGLAAPSRGAAETSVWRLLVPAGKLSESTHQLSREEILVAIAGTALARIGGEPHSFAAGDAIIIPAFVDFALDNPSDAPFEAVAVFPVGGRAILPGAAPFTPPWAV